MNQTEPLSISLFKQKINKLQPNYSIFDSEKVLKTLEYLFSLNTDESRLFIEQEFKIKTADFLEDYIFELADIYFQNPNINDPIITLLIKSNYLPFVSKIEFSKDLQISMQRIERKRLKAILISNEIIQDEKDLKIVFQRIDRKNKKVKLIEIENQNTSSINKNKINWSFTIRIAALFVLILIPLGISLYFFNGDSNPVTISKSRNSSDSKILYAETGDLNELKNIQIPKAKYSNGLSIIETNQRGFGFAQEEEKININLVSFKNQLIYLDNKIEILDIKYQELKSKKIKDKHRTLESIKESKVKCSKEKIKLLALESTYEFKNNNLKLFKREKIDLKSIKVYSLNDEDEHKLYYLRIGEDYYNLQIMRGKLIKVVEEAIIERLDDI